MKLRITNMRQVVNSSDAGALIGLQDIVCLMIDRIGDGPSVTLKALVHKHIVERLGPGDRAHGSAHLLYSGGSQTTSGAAIAFEVNGGCGELRDAIPPPAAREAVHGFHLAIGQKLLKQMVAVVTDAGNRWPQSLRVENEIHAPGPGKMSRPNRLSSTSSSNASSFSRKTSVLNRWLRA